MAKKSSNVKALERKLKNDPKLRAILKAKTERIAQNMEDIIVADDIIDTGELLHSIKVTRTKRGYAASMEREGLEYIEHGKKDRPGAFIMLRALETERMHK